MTERQELWCHACRRYVQFDIDTELEGDHVIDCPSCGHKHYRVVRGGVVTGARWGTANPPAGTMFYTATGTASTAASTFGTYSAGATATNGTTFLYAAWMNSSVMAR